MEVSFKSLSTLESEDLPELADDRQVIVDHVLSGNCKHGPLSVDLGRELRI